MLKCPRDRSVLVRQESAKGPLYRCPECSGLWLPSVVITRHAGVVPRDSQLRSHGTVTAKCCPADAAALIAIHHHDVEIDACPTCNGVWLDAGELEHLLSAQDPADKRRAERDEPADLGDGSDGGDLASDAVSSLFEFLGDLFSGF